MKEVYLAGSIKGLNWCNYVNNELLKHNIRCYNPLRGKEFLSKSKKKLSAFVESDNKFTSPKSIILRDSYGVLHTDLLFVNLLNVKEVSIRTMFEIAWAYWLHKPIIIVMEEDNIHYHPFVSQCALFINDDIDEAIDFTRLVLLG